MPRTVLRLALGLMISSLALAADVTPFEKLDGIPRDWSFVRYARDSERMPLHVALREQNVDEFHQKVIDISTPDHEHYGKHLDEEEVSAWLKPSDTTTSAVRQWLEEHNVTAPAHDGSFMRFHATVEEANKLLGTKFAWFRNPDFEGLHLRVLEYSVPEHLTDHVSFVYPTVKFPTTKPLRTGIHTVGDMSALSAYNKSLHVASPIAGVAPPDAVCNQAITPQCLLSLYNVHYGAKPSTNKLAVASFLNEYARYTDLTLFENTIAMYATGKNFSVVQFNGGQNDQTSTNDSTEANLDVQYTIGVGYPVPITEFSTAGCGPLIPDANEPAGACDNEPYMRFFQSILKLPNKSLPQTLSISYGEDEQTWPKPIAKSVCNLISQLGARGTTVLFSSGDSGPGAICTSNDGSKQQYLPAFPASCPFVTTVGATQHVGPEQVASFSGGGFSNYFARPSYQSAAVTAYLKKIGPKYKPYFNQSGRAYPDVAAQGVNYLVVNTGVTEPVSGTSASSPTFASIVALLNSARISSGKPSLGFLNPLLYSKATKAFNDITVGGSTGCSMGNKTIPGAGWNATTGWDAATGLGTPNFGKLLAIAAPGVKNTGGVV